MNHSLRVVALSILAALALGACSTNKTTGRSQFNALSRQEELAIGEQGKAEMLAEYDGEVERADLRAYVREVGMRLVGTTVQDDPELQQLPWEFFLLDSEVINAFALPGGKVFMSRGLAIKMTNEAQLAGVLGHEIGHVAARHTNDRFARALGLQVGLGIAGIFVGGSEIASGVAELAGQFGQIASLSYDRGQESESDSLGMRYMTRASYDPKGMRQVMDILKQASGDQHPPEWLSTHPLPQTRIDQIESRIARDYAQTQGNPQYKLGEEEFRTKFLSKLGRAFPEGRPEDAAVRLFTMTDGREGRPTAE